MASFSVSQDVLICSVCLDLLKDPVTVPCGHSYCLKCITECWDQEDQKDVYSCPQCRETFTSRPVLRKNTMLMEVVENLRTKQSDAETAAAAERTDKQKRLRRMKGDNKNQLQQREKELQQVQQALHTLQTSAQKAVDESEVIFTELIKLMKQKRSEVTESIRAQERAEVSRAEGLLEQLEMEIAKLKSRDDEMERLLQTEDHVDFLKSFDSCWSVPVSEISSITFTPHLSLTDITPALKKIEKMFLKLNPGFKVGDRIRVKASVKEPEFGCGGWRVNHRSVGVVTALHSSDHMVVRFPECPFLWYADPAEMELVI